MAKSTLFKNNQSQAVRLPKAVAFEEHVREVEIVKIGKGRLILPKDAVWDDFFDGPAVTADFLSERDQPPYEGRETL